jgi:hypothetical protein
MLIRFPAALAALAALALAAPLAAGQAADPPPDPYCPAGDRDLPRGPDWLCYGRLNEDYSFAFVYPKAVERVPELDAAVRTEAGAAEEWIAARAAEARAQGRELPRPSYQAAWQIDAVLPELAAASGAISHHRGGAHGGIEYKTILLDRRRGRAIELEDVFDPGFFEADLLGYRLWGIRAVQAVFCRALTAEARARRGDPAAAIRCPAVEDQPITFMCGDGGRIDRLRVLLNRYAAGAWAEGPYEIDVPVDAAMMSAIRRRFRPAFGLSLESRPRSPVRPCR